MGFKMKLVILLLMFLCSNSYSQTGTGQNSPLQTYPSQPALPINTPSEKVPFQEGTNLKNRENRSWQLAIGPGIEFGIPSLSFNVAYFLSQNSVLNLRYSYRNNYSADGGDKDLTALKFGVKQFTGNSFYYQPNISYRSATHITTADYNYKDINLGVRIGNEWQWENFTLGVDWLGFNQHIIKIDETVNPAGPVPSSIDIEKSLTFDFLGVYLGYTF